MTIKLLVTLGTYEKTLHGIDFKLEDDGRTALSKKVSFSIPAHVGYVKAIAAGPQYLVSGSTDETVRVFDLRRRKDYGSLTCHAGSVSCLSFHKQKMLFSGGEDGKIIVTRCADWETVMTLRGHSGGVHSLAVHPSGKLALSSGKDKMIKTWNLVTGKLALKTKLLHPIDNILWSPSGTAYAYLSERHVQIYVTDGAKNVLDHTPTKKVLTGAFISDTKLVMGCEGPELFIYNFQLAEWSTVMTEHRPRIKDIQYVEAEGHAFIATGSSDGLCCLWLIENGILIQVAAEKSNLRITCLTITTQ